MLDNNAYLDLDAALGTEYFLNRELPQGAGFAAFEGTSKADGTHVEIKSVPLEVFGTGRAPGDSELARRRIQHPNVVPILRAGSYAGSFFWISPSIDGRTLRARLSRGGRMETRDALTVLRDVSAGLTHAHLHGVVHGGLTPDSILISGGSALVSDIGIPEVFGGLRSTRSVERRMAAPAGSEPLRYAAPEQLSSGRADARSDVYAWGVIAYELLGGRHPFAGRSTPREVMAAHVAEEPTALVIPGDDPPQGVSRLVMRCLSKNAAERPETAREILDVMTREMLLPPPAPAAGSGQKIVIGIAVVALLVLAAIVWMGVSG
jgi:serine/threonine-protein kinase